jgi:hypothetical protein
MNIRSDNTFQDINGFGASPDGLGTTVRVAGPNEWLGADEVPAATSVMVDNGPTTLKRGLAIAYGIAGIAGAAIGAYHGYKRNDSIGWAICWSLLGSLAPVIVIPVAYAQGIGERKRGR